MKKYSNEFKAEVLRNGIYGDYCEARSLDFRNDTNGFFEADFDCNHTQEEKGCCKSLYQCKKMKVRRVKERFTPVIWSDQVIFITLTFKDEVLDNTNEETRRKYVRRYLKENCRMYVANIDYGGKNGREHYHAMVVPWDLEKGLDLKPYIKKYGRIDVERVRATSKDNDKVSKYLAKLSNHALKDTGKLPQLIWSRGVRL